MMRRRGWVLLVAFLLVPIARAQAPIGGKAVYDMACAVCHASGVNGAPKFGDGAAWRARFERGLQNLYKSAIDGTSRGMPPKAGRVDLSDQTIRETVDYMLATAGVTKSGVPPTPAAVSDGRAATPKAEPKPAAEPRGAAAPVARQAATAAPPTAPARNRTDAADVNAFNRLLKPARRYNLPAPESGIHDPSNDGTHALQPPAQAFAKLPKSPAGNHVDWVKALETKRIAPRWERSDPKAAPVLMDLNIVREVKGSMPDVVYPHKQHTEWLDCSNCHPSIFVPQKGANQISMAAILLGQKCGVCHGKVAFPVSECRLCHSKKKDAG